MERVASIHITEEHLVLVLKEIRQTRRGAEKLARMILIRGKIYSINERSLLENSHKAEGKLIKMGLSSRDDATIFSQRLMFQRRKLRHKGINIIKPGSKDWGMIKEATALANEFCTDFHLKQTDGYDKYIRLALRKMQKFSLMKLNMLHQGICHEFEAITEIEQDTNPEATEKVMDVYNRMMNERTGEIIDYQKNPEKFVQFLRVRHECKKRGIDPEHYIKAQYEGLEWTGSIPDPSQLMGDKAHERLVKYLSRNKHLVIKTKQGPKIDFTKIKKQ